MDSSGVDTATVRVGLERWRREYILSSSAAKTVDIIAERNLRIFEFNNQ
jgi:hypothetical protein